MPRGDHRQVGVVFPTPSLAVGKRPHDARRELASSTLGRQTKRLEFRNAARFATAEEPIRELGS
jgi:hypothetical protein